jgi:EAL domain-containing protein (putative c-di-GMP-specific phosphodiesterase class I)
MQGMWGLAGPAGLFAYAGRRDRLDALNALTMERAIEASSMLPEGALLFLNADPIAFAGGAIPAVLTKAASKGCALERIVLEITERSAFPDSPDALRSLDRVRDLGVKLALDDHGSAWSHLGLIDRIRPDLIKISASFGTSFERDETKRRIVRNVAALARDFGARTVIEGIESAATADAAEAEGIELAQGFYFGYPAAAWRWSAGALRAA